MAELSQSKKVKDRSPAFPFIALERALQRAGEFYAEEKRGAAPYTRVVLHWNYTETSSGGLQTLAALKHYGLMEDVGGTGVQRQVRLTELALRILLDTRPDSAEREGYIRQAAMMPPIVTEIYKKWPEGLPGDATINHFLVLEKKFNQETARTTRRILKENQEFAKLAAKQLQSEDAEIETEDVIKVETQNRMAGGADTEGARKVAPSVPQKVRVTTNAPHVEQFTTEDGEQISIHFDGKPTSATWEFLSDYATYRGARMKKVEAAQKLTASVVKEDEEP